MTSPLPPLPEGRTAAGCAVGLGCIVVALLIEAVVVGAAALRILGIW